MRAVLGVGVGLAVVLMAAGMAVAMPKARRVKCTRRARCSAPVVPWYGERAAW
jgi:hypothetical protein